jgi:predicted SAM-dependent methyltransferase
VITHKFLLDNLKLELGAGDRPTPGFIHNDARPLPDIEIVCPVEEITAHVKGHADEIRATHLLEHFSWRDTVALLTEWRELVIPGGKVYIEVPNLTWQTNAHAGGHDDIEIVNLIFGDQDYEGNYHKAAFTERLLRRRMEEAGLHTISVIDIGMVLCGEGFRQ